MSDALNRGITGHSLLKAYFSATGGHQARLAVMANQAVVELRSNSNPPIVAAALILAKGFVEWYEDRISGWIIETVEAEYMLDFPDFTYAFTVDACIYDTDGQKKFVDWKFTYDFYDADFMSLAPQLPRYVGAARALGLNVRDGMYGFIRYRKLNNESDKYLLAPLRLSTPRIQNAFRDLVNASERMLDLRSLEVGEWETKVSRNANQTVCRSCPFKSLCAVEANGGDGKMERKFNYEVNTRYGYAVEED
jgi:hypothetical protein